MALVKLCRVLIVCSITWILAVDVGYGKAVPDEPQGQYEGPYEYSYGHENEDPGFKYYDPQNYLVHPLLPPPQKKYYTPIINGYPIVVPRIDDSSSDINRMLKDHFSKKEKVPEHSNVANVHNYKSLHYTVSPASKHANSPAYNYETDGDYEKPVTVNVVSKNHGVSGKKNKKEKHKNKKPHIQESKDSFVPYEVQNTPSGKIKDKVDPVSDKHGGKNFYVSKVKAAMKVSTEDYDYDLPVIHETINVEDFSQKGKEVEEIDDYDYDLPVIHETIKMHTIEDFTKKDKEKIKEINDYDSQKLKKDEKKTKVPSQKEKPETPDYKPEKEMDFDLPVTVKVKKAPGSKKPHKTRKPGIKHVDKSKVTKITQVPKIPTDEDSTANLKPKDNPHDAYIPVLEPKNDHLTKDEKHSIKCTKSKLNDLDCSEESDNLNDSPKMSNAGDFYAKTGLTESESKKSLPKKPHKDNPNSYTSFEEAKTKTDLNKNKKSTVKGNPNLVKPSDEMAYSPKSQFSESTSSETIPGAEHSDIGEEMKTLRANTAFDIQSLGSGNAEDSRSLSLNDKARNFLSSFSPNLWSLVFNPNAQDNKVKKCVTRNEESGFCTYIQNCPVSNIATTLEQLLNNACVVDEMFIGVCCPEFPVDTIQVHWETIQGDSSDKNFESLSHDVEDCGTISKEVAKDNLWPWKAPLVSMSNGKIFCGGVVITDEYVLTAAHCTTKIPKNRILVRLGQQDDSSGEDYPVIEIKRHAQYNPRTLHNDIALLKLGRRIVRNEHVGSVCLPEGDDDNDDHDGDKAILLGWQRMFGKNPKKEQPEELEVMSLKECRAKMGVTIPDSMMCTEARNENERTCNADSGAPLIVEDDDKYEVIGILSWNRNDCDQRFPSTFSRVSSYLGWIRKHAV